MERTIEEKIEGSIPVQARIDVKSLATLDVYWTGEGYRINSMSQLINFSVELLVEILRANGKLSVEARTVSEAHRHLVERELYQRSLKDRSFKKIGMAIAFENMRKEGADPRVYAKEMFNRMHRAPDQRGNPSTVQPFTGRVDNEVTKRAMEIMESLPKDRNSSLLDELSGITYKMNRDESGSEKPILKECGNDPEAAAAYMKRIEQEDQKKLDELNSFDPSSLIGKGIKEK